MMTVSNIVMRTILVSFTFFNCAAGKRIPAFAGPYRAIVRTTNNETEEFKSSGKNWSRIYYSSPKPGDTVQFGRGFYYSAIELTDALKMDVRVSVRSNNQWKRNAFVVKMNNFCSSLMTHARFIVDFLYLPEERKCPLPKIGLREVRNQTMQPLFPHFSVGPYGRYRFTMAIIDGEEVVGINVSEVDAVPKL